MSPERRPITRRGFASSFLRRLTPLRGMARRRGLVLLARHHPRATRWLAMAAAGGDAEALFQLGACYLAGIAMPRSAIEAEHWLRLAAQAGHVRAQEQLTMLLIHGRAEQAPASEPFRDARPADMQEAAIWAHAAAEAGSARSQALLGWLLRDGPPELRDTSASEDWYRRSAAQGFPEGALGYGMALLHAARSPAEKTAGAAEVEKAANAGLPAALYLAGLLAEAGVAGPADSVRAARWLRAAALAGSPDAGARWGKALIIGDLGGRRDVRSGRRWLERAAGGGNGEAAALLGDLYYRGEAWPADPVAALAWYRRAAALGHAAARQLVAKWEAEAAPPLTTPQGN